MRILSPMESQKKIYRWDHSPSIFLSSSAGSAPAPSSSIRECEPKLTHLSHGHRTSRPPPLTVRSTTTISLESNSSVAISASLKLGTQTTTSQDVLSPLNTSAAFIKPSTATRNGSSASASSDASSYSLAAHYGIPQSLPRPPRTTTRATPALSQEKLDDFESLSRNYLSMLATKSSDNSTTMSTENDQIDITVMPPPPVPHAVEEDPTAAMQAVVDTLIGTPSPVSSYSSLADSLDDSPLSASPEFSMLSDFLSSPFSTPYDDFSTSPMDDSPFSQDLSTPIMDSYDDEFGWMATGGGFDMNEPLFNDPASALYEMIAEPVKEPAPVSSSAAELLSNKSLFTMSPATPALESVHSLYPSPRLPVFTAPAPKSTTTSTPAAPSTRKGSSGTATGTRRNITPDALVPLDAPTQNRRYVTPSSTSRKEPSSKRSRSEAFGDAEDEEELPPMQAPGPDATDIEKLEWKRRLSTIAARKSRRRKLEHKLMLESKVDDLEKDKEKWKTRCKVLQEVLRSHAVDFRFEDDDEP